ncbi:hypothetical protein E8L90_21660 [Brevibacillus antibioticus]|uniref:Uncharacterized protein n=1 Tax=Brevibacillus antibioticus TaxID=2570228 RepID=A0A4U2YAQ6_9BACL|nr:hypothetical protein [Brevibacillus antibioticus]TKI57826.1 hypothetical protein E8L90_21660 [Brevibacillus antibioticus]
MEIINNKSEIFIGARDLGDEVYKILPTFDLIVKQIEQIRGTTKDSIKDSYRSHSQRVFKKDVNNTIGIFGARGTGKTSVLYTLINQLSLSDSSIPTSAIPHNIVLGIIEPDHFGHNTKIMGSVVGLLKKATEMQMEQIQNMIPIAGVEGDLFQDYFNKGVFKPNNPLQNSLNELIEYHMYTESEYRQLLIHTYDDLATHIKKSARLLTPDIEFKEKLNSLISYLIANQRALLRLCKGKEDVEPLLFLFIDDIDLKMTRSRELIEAILQYANHPNVVTILSGDYDILQESIMLALIQDEKLHHSNMSVEFKVNDRDTIKDRKQNLAHEYVKKIIPPARRHQLLQWNENTIPQFAFGDQTLMIQLEKLLGNKNIFNYKLGNGQKLQPINKSYSIFDQTPRGIVNVYYHIHEINERFPEIWSQNNDKQDRFNIIKSLIDTIILSSTNLAAKQSPILKRFIQWGHDPGSTFLDYSALDDIVSFTQESDKAKKTDYSLLLPLVIIGEVIQKLLGEIRFDQKACKEQELNLLRYLLQIEPMNVQRRTRLGIIADTVVSYVSFQNALFFTNQAATHLDWFIQKPKETAEQPRHLEEIQNRWMLILIKSLLDDDKDPELLTRLYYDQYIRAKQGKSGSNNVSTVMEFLANTSARRADYIYYKSLYDYPESSKSWSEIVKSMVENTQYIDDLFVYLLIQIHSWDDKTFNEKLTLLLNSGENDGTTNKVATRLKSILNKLILKQAEGDSLTPNQSNIINKLITGFYHNLFERLRRKINEQSFTIEWKDESTVKMAVDMFLKGYSGVTNTKYQQTKDSMESIKSKIENYITYGTRNNIVEKLSSNYAVWYGRKEAERLLYILKEEAYIDPMNLEPDELWVIRNLDYYLKKVNNTVFTDDQYETVKAEMRKKLVEAFDQAKQLVVSDLDALGIELGEDEEQEDTLYG